MEYVPVNNASKRNIDQTTSNEDEFFNLPNKRSCLIEKVPLQSQDSIQSLKVHTGTEWNFTNTDFEHAISTESINHLRTRKTKPMPIIFHFASEDIIDIEKYQSNHMITELNSISSATTFSVDDFRTISMKRTSPLNFNKDNSIIIKCTSEHKENAPACQSKINSSHLFETILTKNSSSLSISDTSLDRLEICS